MAQGKSNKDLITGKVVGAVTLPVLMTYGTYAKLITMTEDTGMPVDVLMSVLINEATISPGPGKVGLSLSCNKRLK